MRKSNKLALSIAVVFFALLIVAVLFLFDSTDNTPPPLDLPVDQGDSSFTDLTMSLLPFCAGFLTGIIPLAIFLWRSSVKNRILTKSNIQLSSQLDRSVAQVQSLQRNLKLHEENPKEKTTNPFDIYRTQSPENSLPRNGAVREEAVGGSSEYPTYYRSSLKDEPPGNLQNYSVNTASLCRDYNLLISAHRGRDAFISFFNELKRGENGNAQEIIRVREFVEIVVFEDQRVAFPNFDFVSMLDTHFATLASIPEEIRELYDLEKGDGEIQLEKLALLNSDNTLRSRGILRGFSG